MNRIIRLLYLIPLISSMMILGSQLTFSQDENFTVRIFPRKGDSFIINNFTRDKVAYWGATWRGSRLQLFFKDIKTISFVSADAKNQAEITFRDGRKDVFLLETSYGTVYGDSQFGKWEMWMGEIAKIEFISPGAGLPSTASVSSEFDQVILKNGDMISGQVKTRAFSLRASYGTLSFQTEEIQSIHFEGGGQNTDIVVLRVGDKLSGVIQEKNVTILLRSGGEITFEKDKVKDINLKK